MQNIILSHLETLVSFRSKTSDQQAVKNLLEYCREAITKSGAFTDTTIHTFDGFHSLTASTQSTKRPKVLLQAHIDVVPAPRDLAYKVDIAKNRVYGRGVFDMLFATACYLALIEDCKSILPDLDIGIMLTGDEEIGGFNGVKTLLEQGYGGDICILPDAGRGYGDLNAAAKGFLNVTVVADGKAHHGSRPWEGDGAGNKLVYLIHELVESFDMTNQDNSTITVATISGGDAENKGPSSAESRLDIRYKDQQDLTKIQNKLDTLCAKYGAHLENITNGVDYKLDIDHPLVNSFIELTHQHTGKKPILSKAHGSSDARFFSERNIPVIMMRPEGYGAHGDTEYLELDNLEAFYLLIKEFVIKTATIS